MRSTSIAQLSTQHLITTTAELREALEEIDDCEASTSSKTKKKLALIRLQINIRKKVLNQKLFLSVEKKDYL